MFTWYNCSDDKKVVHKNMHTARTDTNTIIYGDNNVLSPILKSSEYNNETMVKISQFNDRIYFVDNVTFSKGYYYIQCSIDVLSTYKDSIDNISALVIRNENKSFSNIPDNAVITNVNKNIRTIELTGGVPLGNVLNSRNFVLTVV